MNILFLTMNIFMDIEMHNIYSDLMKEFIKHDHTPYIVTPREKKMNESTELINYESYSILKVKTGNISNVSLFEKGISIVTLNSFFYKAIKKNLSHLKFELILYSTPPITLASSISKLKKYWGCNTYLMLKDIFPQNAVDMGMFSKKSILYRYFRNQEKRLYQISDYIGCMSYANIDYVIRHNPKINPEIVEMCPNSIDVNNKCIITTSRELIRKKYDIPLDKQIFIYGGNLGKPQGIDFLIKCIYSQRKNKNVFFIVIGDGTEYKKLEKFTMEYPQDNFKLMKHLSRDDYDTIVCACDVGLIFLDYRFTIPNFPSRLLNYMQARIPILACTDLNTDIGKVIEEGGFGWWCESNNVKGFNKKVKEALKANKDIAGENAYQYLLENYNVKVSYKTIIKHYH